MSNLTAATGESSPLEAPLIGRRAGAPRYAFAGAFVLASFITAVSVFLTAGAPGAHLAVPPEAILLVLSANLVLILALAAVAGLRVFSLFRPGVHDAGVRLHRRFVLMFALAAVAPAVIVALFFGLLVTQGVENWFSDRVRTVVNNAATVARAYVDEQSDFLRNRIVPIAEDLNRNEPGFERSRIQFSALLMAEAVERDLAAVYVIDSDGRVLARAEQPSAPPFLTPPVSTFRQADQGDVTVRPFASDFMRALYRLRGYPDAYVYVARPMGEGIMAQLRRAQQSVVAYREADRNRARIQAIFVLSYAGTAILVLVGAVWLGMSAATQIAAPVARLVQAADRVSGGDLGARVPIDRDPEEIAVLSRAFNRMTSDLQEQQAALKAASREAQARRRFIETVLSGVSAGVIGLDPEGRISAINAQALRLLGLTEPAALGLVLGDVAPELEPVADQAVAAGHDAEAEVDVVRGPETRRLRVRASGRSEGGLVLTFDDITRLVAAQRNAAWRDVARRIAHEIKNPLTPIQLSAERLRRKYRREIGADVETFDRCTDTIIRQVGDIGRMVDEFSAFARMPAPTFAQEDAAELLRQAVFSQRVADPDIAVELEAPAGPVPLVCDGRMVAQALLNVLKNAGEAVSARVAAHPEPPGRIIARLMPEDGQVVFEFEDNGVGLPAKDRDRLSEPYVTTREKGTGLGLAIVKRILEEHGGELVMADAATAPGARVLLRFPQHRRASASAPADAAVA